jgi:Domain of unknown function (DUF4157)
MEGPPGTDVNRVKIYSGGSAAAWAARLGALAFPVGDDAVLGQGFPSLHSLAGRRALSRELAQVVQQRIGGPPPSGDADSAAERDAERTASALANGRPRPPALIGTAEPRRPT